MVCEPRKQSIAWMETDYSNHTHFRLIRWKIKWRLEHWGALRIMGKCGVGSGFEKVNPCDLLWIWASHFLAGNSERVISRSSHSSKCNSKVFYCVNTSTSPPGETLIRSKKKRTRLKKPPTDWQGRSTRLHPVLLSLIKNPDIPSKGSHFITALAQLMPLGSGLRKQLWLPALQCLAVPNNPPICSVPNYLWKHNPLIDGFCYLVPFAETPVAVFPFVGEVLSSPSINYG